MAEVEFFMTRDDTRAFVEFLIHDFDARFALDDCSTPEPPVYESAEKVMAIVEESEFAPRFFVQSPLWDRCPLITTEIHANDGRHFFSIDQRYGGPAFDYYVSRFHAEGDVRYVMPGWFSDYPWYYVDDDPSKCRTFDRPEKMAEAYRAVQKYLRRNGKRSRSPENGNVGPWILNDALAQYRRGLWLRRGEIRFEPRSSK